MCGIAGHLSTKLESEGNRQAVSRMCNHLTHRGPDDHGLIVDGPACLGHRRLSIIDLSAEAAQPMENEDGTIFLVINGEIYNFEELRDQLVSKGHKFKSRSDSEVVLHLYEENGVDFLDKLRGMFALALWDSTKKRLILARDPVGKKPLFYYVGQNGIFFSSELLSLISSREVPREFDLDAIDAYLALQYVPSPMSAFKNVNKLAPGHRVICNIGQAPHVERYYHLSFDRQNGDRPQDAVAELREKFEEAVRIRMVSDVPLGAFLSGGLDSSFVVACMAQISSEPIKTFSVGFPQEDHSELEYARMVAKRYKTDHHEMIVEPKMVSIIPTLVRHYGEPFADASAVPTYYLSEYTKQFVTVALSGDGGDEGFAGYNRYKYAMLARTINKLPLMSPQIISFVLSHLPLPQLQPIRKFGQLLKKEEVVRYLGWIAHFPHNDRLNIYQPELKKRFAADQVANNFSEILEHSTSQDEVGRLLDLDTQTYLPDDILVKVDIASMAHGLEVRAPFLDKDFMQFSSSLPSFLKMRGLGSKLLLKQATNDLLPSKIVNRPKQGFGLPIDRWMRQDLASMSSDLLLDRTARQRGIFDPTAIENLLKLHAQGQPRGLQIWNLVMLEQWFRLFIDQEPNTLDDTLANTQATPNLSNSNQG